MPDMTFAGRLTQLRGAAGLSQYEVARRAGVTRQTLSRLEMGESVPSWPTVQALARALGVEVGAFVVEGKPTAEPVPRRARGRPRKDAAEQAAAKPTGKAKQKKGRGKQ